MEIGFKVWLICLTCSVIALIVGHILIFKFMQILDEDENKDFSNLMKLMENLNKRIKLLQDMTMNCDNILAKELTKFENDISQYKDTIRYLVDDYQKEKLLNRSCREAIRGLIEKDKEGIEND